MKMHLSIGWHITGAVCLLLTMALIGVISGDANLCEKFKFGATTILAMGITQEKELIILDTNYAGFEVSLEKLVNETGSPYNGPGPAYLDLVGAVSFQLKGAKSLPKRTNGTNAFIFYCSFGYSDLKVHPWKGMQLAFLGPEQITTIPLGEDYVRTFSCSFIHSTKNSEVFFSSMELCKVMMRKTAREIENMIFTLDPSTGQQMLFRDDQSNSILLVIDTNVVEGGVMAARTSHALGFNNVEKTMIIFEPDKEAIKVPFKDFFQCEFVAVQKKSSLMNLGIAVLVVVFFCMCVLCCLMLGKSETRDKQFSLLPSTDSNPSTASTSNVSTAYSMKQIERSKVLQKLQIKKIGKDKPSAMSSVTSSMAGKGKTTTKTSAGKSFVKKNSSRSKGKRNGLDGSNLAQRACAPR